MKTTKTTQMEMTKVCNEEEPIEITVRMRNTLKSAYAYYEANWREVHPSFAWGVNCFKLNVERLEGLSDKQALCSEDYGVRLAYEKAKELDFILRHTLEELGVTK